MPIVLVMIIKKGAVREKRSVGSFLQFRWYPPYGIICSRQQLKRITNGETSHSSASRVYWKYVCRRR